MASDPPALTFRGQLTEQDAVRLQLYQLALAYPRPLRWPVGVGLKLAGAGVLYWITEAGGHPAFLLAVFAAWAAGLLLFFLPVTEASRARADYRRHPDRYPEATVRLADGGVSVENEGGRYDLPWAAVTRVADGAAGMLFCGPRHAVWFFLPARLLGDVGREEVRLLLVAQGVAVRAVD